MRKQILVNVLKYTLGFSLLAWVVWKNWSPPPNSGGIGIAEALQKPLQLTPLLLASAICLASLLLTFVRWYVLVRAQSLPFTIPNAIRLGFMGYALSTFLPGSIGGDVFKAYYIAREQERRTVAVATVLVDRAVGLWGLVWIVTLLGGSFWLLGNTSLREQRSLQVVVLIAGAIVAASVLLWLVLGVLPQWRADRFAGRLKKIPKIGSMVSEFWRAIWMYRCQGRCIALALFLAVTGHIGFVLTFFFAAQAFLPPDHDRQIPTLAEHFVLVPIGMTWQALFPSPGGVGGGEYGFGKLYALIGQPEANGVLASLVARLINWGLAIVGYVIYLRMKPTLPENGNGAVGQAARGEINPTPVVMTQ